jgi:hypothetical protein
MASIRAQEPGDGQGDLPARVYYPSGATIIFQKKLGRHIVNLSLGDIGERIFYFNLTSYSV